MANNISQPTPSNSFISAWGEAETKYFYELTPERILSAVEAYGLRCTGRCLALNSLENRVYEVEVVAEDASLETYGVETVINQSTVSSSPSEHFRIVKFYRPGRWTAAQIREEHQFLLDLVSLEIPVVAPLRSTNGETLLEVPDCQIFYSLFPKIGGRNPQELSDEQLPLIGRLLARLHNCGAVRQAEHRITLSPDSYGRASLKFLLDAKILPPHIETRYADLVNRICDIADPLFEGVATQRIHGDCHLGNLLWGREGPFWVDFDDMVVGPCVQDLWLVVPGRDEQSRWQMSILIEGYEQMREFDHRTLKLIEPLRALRMIHFSGWIAKRAEDPAFSKVFLDFGTERYWSEQITNLQEQLELITTPEPYFV